MSKTQKSKSQKSKSPKTPVARKSSALPKALRATQVFSPCPISAFSFTSTKQLEPNHDIIAQSRAVHAIRMGLGIRRPGYNIYVAGTQGTGKTSVIRSFLEQWTEKTKPAKDWVYIYNFRDPDKPQALSLRPGRAKPFAKAVAAAVKKLREEIPRALQSEDYENAVNSYVSQSNDLQSRRFSELEKRARSMNFQVKSTRMGIETIPIVEGRVLTEKEYSKLSDTDKTKLEETRATLEPEVLEFARQIRALESDTREYVQKLQRQVGEDVTRQIFTELRDQFQDHEGVIAYVDEMVEHVIDHLLDFVDNEEGLYDEEGPTSAQPHDHRDKFKKYRVNVFVDNTDSEHVPIVIDSNPTYYNMFGKIEKNIEHGMYLTDHTMIQAGSVHRANGGYLVVDANDLFKMSPVWETLKRVLRNNLGYIEDMGEQYSLLPASALRPEPIPLDIKVILTGNDEIYHILHEADEEFPKLFKIKADFDYKMKRNRTNVNAYASFIATRCHKEDLLHFDRSGVAAVVEYGSRLVEDQAQLSTQFASLKDVTIEADYVARGNGDKRIRRSHVQEAIEHRFQRVALFEQHLMEMVESGDIMLSVSGERIGQVNGLAVYDLGDCSFGKLGRITCTIAINDDGILNIDRASKLSGNIHDKSVYILSGFLNALLAREHSLGFSASVCFEQSYGIIDGDSATVAEVIAIISAIANIPIRQNLAVTGSLNQFGDVQSVGGINEKAEGFYKTCRLLGRGKKYTLIIPHQNTQHLMLAEDVREAVKSGYLEVIPVKFFWEAFELATGIPFGAKKINDKTFASGSALEVIAQKLEKIHADPEAPKSHHEAHSVTPQSSTKAKKAARPRRVR